MSEIGNDEGQVPLGQLQKYLNKLPRNIDTTRKLNPALQTFEQFVTKQKDAILKAMG